MTALRGWVRQSGRSGAGPPRNRALRHGRGLDRRVSASV